ncbi:calcium-binding protein 1-like [Neolamprologus brichardi]|uniref:calcium-binding protein 1-like n=1 Tax=Neolamprologus brichardi TaxID=32507 RepID=UPI0003EBE287|nr:calcium-binding protein 1-like [Neolamprologus brichardi]
MFMIIREPASGAAAGAMSVPPERSAKQVQAAIKKKVEKQKKRTNDQGGGGGGGGDAQAAARNQKSKLPPMTAAEAGEDSEALEEQLEELMEGPRRREKEKEKEEEPVDLLPIVDSVFGQRVIHWRFHRKVRAMSQQLEGDEDLDVEDKPFKESLGALVKNCNMLHNIVGPACIFLKQGFARTLFDSNGDGQISLTELREAMKKLMGEQVTNREINEILKDADLNGDGLVDFEEFVRMMSR